MSLSTRRLFVAILFIALFVMTAREIADPDFWWHLSTGKYILETRSIPHVDVFSGTVAGQPWVAHEWLSEVFIYAVFALGSFPALILLFSGIITLAFAFVYARSGGKPYVATFALLLAAVATAPMWGVRPQMVSLLLTSVFLWVLEKWWAEAGDPKHRLNIWILAPLMILWVNLHSGYALGLAVIAIYLFGEGIRVIASREAAKQSPSNVAIASSHPSLPSGSLLLRNFALHKFLPSCMPAEGHGLLAMTHTRVTRHSPLVTLSLVFLACLLVVPLNPNGAAMYVYPFETLTSRAMQAYIQEWFSPDFHLIEFQPFAWLLLATLAAIGLSGKRVSLTQTLLLVGSGYAGLRSGRNIPIFAIIAAPILAEHLWHIVETRGWAAALAGSAQTPRRIAVLNWLLLLVIVAAGITRIGMVVANQSAIERNKFPAAAVDFLQAQKVTGTIYNSYGWGGYLIWRLYPGARVFIDGRADVYGDVFIEEFLNVYRGGADWRAPLEQYGVRVVLIEPDALLATQLARDAVWRKVYEDKQAVVWER